jgi:hypothetical protein
MKTIAIIQNGVVISTATWDGVSAWNPGSQYILVDITNTSPQPTTGWTTTDNVVFTAPVSASMSETEIVSDILQQAQYFGANMSLQFATQNMLAGITQSGKTIAVATYAQTLAYYLQTGSLYAAITEINTMIADTSSIKTALSPFVTNSILYSYLNQIQAYLGIVPTANPGS